MSAAARTEICIVGGGLVGASAAAALARAGRRVVLVERGRLNGAASGVNFGGVRRHGRFAAELPLAIRAHAIWMRVRELTGSDCEFEQTGHLKLARAPEDMAELEAWSATAREHGIDVELLGAGKLAEAHPWLARGLAGASFCPGDGHANPRLAGLAFAKGAAGAGAVLREDSAVLGVEDAPAGRFRVELSRGGAIEADILVNAAGAWGSDIAARYGDHVPLTPVAPQMFVTEPVAHVIGPVLGMVGAGLYLRQIQRGNVILGGGRGVVLSGGLRSRPLAATFHATLGLARALIPHLGLVSVIRSWTGVEGSMAGSLPVIGESPSRSGLFHAFGFSGHGFQLAPAVGETIAELIARGSTDIDLSPFAVRRFPQAAPQLHRAAQ